ncbi:MAG: hypothetical protein AB8E15_00375 [Bdellovibrionales bacterium]
MFRILCIFAVLFTAGSAFSIEDVSLLPKGVRGVLVKSGWVTEVENKYSSNYQLSSLQYRVSQRVDANFIQKIEPQFKQFVETMDSSFPQYNIGSQVYLGDVIVEAEPEIQFTAPIIGYGVTDRWTIGLAVPQINLEAAVKVEHVGANNINEIFNSLPGNYQDHRGDLYSFSQRLQEAYSRLQNVSDLRASIDKFLKDNDYQGLDSVSQKYLGDILVINRYLVYKSPSWRLMLRNHLNLPTGPADDPSNLLDLPIFNRTFLDTALVTQYNFGSFKFHNNLSVKYNLSDKSIKRVPRSDMDLFPSSDREENLDRKIGDSVKYEFNVQKSISDSWGASIGIVKEWKQKDYYSGNRNYNYNLLSRNTDMEQLQVQLSTSYHTLNQFTAKKFPIPLLVSYSYSDTVAGKNVERQSIHEINLGVVF